MNNMIKLIGLLASFCFSFAAVPQAFKTLKLKKHLGTPFSIILSVFLGTIFMYSYLTLSYGWDLILFITYGIEFISWMILLIFYFRK
jgi:hypothetical protein